MNFHFPRLTLDYKKYCVVGTRVSGKTVLLASLLDNIQKNGKRFDNWESVYWGDLEGINRFPIDEILRDIRQHNAWPRRTSEVSGIRVTGTKEASVLGWKYNSKVIRDFIDIPGERFADFVGSDPERSSGFWDLALRKMGRSHQTFGEWSKKILFLLSGDEDSKAKVDAYKALLLSQQRVSSRDEILSAYKRLVRDAWEKNRYALSPSTLVSRFENELDEIRADDFPDSFAPLPDSLPEAYTATRNEFEQEFNRYQNEVIDPLRMQILESDAILIPVDMNWMLNTATTVVNEQHRLLEAFALSLKQMVGSAFGKAMISAVQRRFQTSGTLGNLKKIIILATKMDIFRPSASEHEKLLKLLRHFAERMESLVGRDLGITVTCTACSALQAALPVKDSERYLSGWVKAEDDMYAFSEMEPDALPEEWPSDDETIVNRENPVRYRLGTQFVPRLHGNDIYPIPNRELDELWRELEN